MNDLRYVDCKYCGTHCTLGWDHTAQIFVALCERCHKMELLTNIYNPEKDPDLTADQKAGLLKH